MAHLQTGLIASPSLSLDTTPLREQGWHISGDNKMAVGHVFWKFVTLLFVLGVIGSIATVVLFSIELVRVILSKDNTAVDYTPQDSTTSGKL